MIFLDSWVWLEFCFDGDRSERAADAIEKAVDDGGVVAATVLAEVAYRIRRETGSWAADLVIDAIERFESVEVAPVTSDVARRAAALRDRYYERGACELSYADAIHAATTMLTGCSTLYSGDRDFVVLDDEIDVEIL